MSCTEAAKLLDGLHVLIVEDEPLIGMSVEEAIRDAGGVPTHVENDRDAYAELEARVASLGALVVDVNLGEGTTGFDVARFARRLNPALPVLYLSGGPEQWAAWFGVDGAAFLSKPVADAELIRTIAELNDRNGRPDRAMPLPRAT